MGLSGRARLSPSSSTNAWRNAELRLDIESEKAEVVQAQVRIESPNANSDVLLHSSQISFASGPAHTFSIRLLYPGGTGTRSRGSSVAVGGPWPTRSPLEVVVSPQDR